jgi:hypothetical protein
MSNGGSPVKVRVLAALALFLACLPGFSQESVRLVPRRLLLSVAAAPGSEFTPADARMILRSLHQRLQEADAEIVFVEPASEPASPAQEGLNALADQAGADCWMLLSVAGGWASARIHARAFDLLLKTAVADLTAPRSAWGSPGGLSQETWSDVSQAIAGKFPMRESAAPASGGPKLVRLLIRALPGSVVTGLGALPLKVGADGAAFRMMPPLKEYSFRTDLAGYVPVSTRIYLAADREVEVQQRRPSTWGLEASLADSRAPGVDVSLYFPASIFARFGFSTYAIGLALDSTGVLLDIPLTNLALQVGMYTSPEDRFFRFYLALGGFVRLVHAPGTFPVTDRLAPGGARLILGTEARLSDRGKLYLELTPAIYQTISVDALRASLGQDTAPGWAFGPGLALNLLSFRIGYRWRP